MSPVLTAGGGVPDAERSRGPSSLAWPAALLPRLSAPTRLTQRGPRPHGSLSRLLEAATFLCRPNSLRTSGVPDHSQEQHPSLLGLQGDLEGTRPPPVSCPGTRRPCGVSAAKLPGLVRHGACSFRERGGSGFTRRGEAASGSSGQRRGRQGLATGWGKGPSAAAGRGAPCRDVGAAPAAGTWSQEEHLPRSSRCSFPCHFGTGQS